MKAANSKAILRGVLSVAIFCGSTGAWAQQKDDRHDAQHRDDHHDAPRHDAHAAAPHFVRHDDWRKGGRMNRDDWNRGRRLDYRAYRLDPPRRGYEWREVDGNYVMAAIATGLIVTAIIASTH